MLGTIKHEIMHPVLETPLAKLSCRVTEGIAKTFSEFTDGQRLRKIEAKITANANKQLDATTFHDPAISAGDESEEGFLKKLNKKLLGKDKKISPDIIEGVSKLSDQELIDKRSKILIKHPNEYENAIIYEHEKRFSGKAIDDGIQIACERAPALMHGIEKLTGKQVCNDITPIDVAENIAGNSKALTNLKQPTALKDKPTTKPVEPSTVKKEIKVEETESISHLERKDFATLTKKELDTIDTKDIVIDKPYGSVSVKLPDGQELTKQYKDINTNLTPQNVNQLKHYSNEMRRNLTRADIIDVQDSKLYKIMDQLYRKEAKIGSGSSGAAYLQESLTGKQVGNKWHNQKIPDYIEGLKNWLKDYPDAAIKDRQIAEHLLRDMENSLNEAKQLEILRDNLK